jgi:hypothetical protein
MHLAAMVLGWRFISECEVTRQMTPSVSHMHCLCLQCRAAAGGSVCALP